MHNTKTFLFILSVFFLGCLFLLLESYKIYIYNDHFVICLFGNKKNISFDYVYKVIVGKKTYTTGNMYLNVRYYKDASKTETDLVMIGNQIFDFENLSCEIKNKSTNAKIISEQ